jgi:hypothetical protein
MYIAALTPCNYGVLQRRGTVKLGESVCDQYIAVVRFITTSTRVVALCKKTVIWIMWVRGLYVHNTRPF